MTIKLSKLAVVIALILSLGVHWALLQSVAWMGMIVSYSRNASLVEAVNKTFDGKHLCKLCKVIQKGKSEEKKQEQLKTGFKIEVGLIWESLDFVFASNFQKISSLELMPLSRAEEPPRPPPRSVLFFDLA